MSLQLITMLKSEKLLTKSFFRNDSESESLWGGHYEVYKTICHTKYRKYLIGSLPYLSRGLLYQSSSSPRGHDNIHLFQVSPQNVTPKIILTSIVLQRNALSPEQDPRQPFSDLHLDQLLLDHHLSHDQPPALQLQS